MQCVGILSSEVQTPQKEFAGRCWVFAGSEKGRRGLILASDAV